MNKIELDGIGGEVAKSLNKLLAINPPSVGVNNEVNAYLAAEYIRRAAKLSQEFHLDLQSPFFSPRDFIEISGDQSAAAMAEFDRCGNPTILRNGYLRRSCECFLQWSEAVDKGEVLAIACPGLFDPLIKIVSNGGTFGVHRGELMVGDSAIPLNNWKRFLQTPPYISD
jgi:hypothetical protein